ncbi:hypothetical protein HDV64DRAFT_119000 [Trichoderma sp. TUCIM 5745]
MWHSHTKTHGITVCHLFEKPLPWTGVIVLQMRPVSLYTRVSPREEGPRCGSLFQLCTKRVSIYEPRAWDTCWQVFAISKSRDVISTLLSCVARRTRGCFLFPPCPFATQPATHSSECSLWSTVSYHHRKYPCRAGTYYGTEI